ncbi:class I SAM-dependent methyltransferase [Nocardia sp. NPDC088792]|uniref:class I SAM-dependent methyltransferase n=1 Tax=Nocardia sp. NPDC088792 TaxID=3364332 RepID=UPI0037F48A43
MIDQPVIGDAFGEALMEELEHGDAFEVDERDDGYVKVHPISRYFADYPDWPDLEAAALDSISGRVLDLGAGAGRATLELQKRGQPVLAIDSSPLAVEVCRRRGVEERMLGTIFDIPSRDEMFSCILMLGGNLGLLQNPATVKEFLAAASASTRPGAQIFALGTDPYRTKDPAHLQYYAHNRAAGRTGGHLRLRIRHRHTATPWFDQWLLSLPELEAVLAGTPWFLDSACRDGARYLATLARR